MNLSKVSFFVYSLFTVGVFAASVDTGCEVSVSQLSTQCYETGEDSVVVYGTKDNPNYYERLEIYRGGKRIFIHNEEKFEIEAFQGGIFKDCNYRDGKFLYFIKCNDRPSPEHYLVLLVDDTTVSVVGYTPAVSTTIFGDIDGDGTWEIGGYSNDMNFSPVVYSITNKILLNQRLTQQLKAMQAKAHK